MFHHDFQALLYKEPAYILTFKVQIIWYISGNVMSLDLDFHFIYLFEQKFCFIISIMLLVYIERRGMLFRTYVSSKVYLH